MPDIEITLLVMLAYMAGLLGFMILVRERRRWFDPHGSSTAPATWEQRGRMMMKEYEDMLVDIMVRLDMVEMRGEQADAGVVRPQAVNAPSQQSQHLSQPARDAHHNRSADASGEAAIPADGGGGGGAGRMVDYVVKLLVEAPRTSRQIELLIGRSREHTARLMKRLFEGGYVTRDSTAKPYVYSITEKGRMAVQEPSISA